MGADISAFLRGLKEGRQRTIARAKRGAFKAMSQIVGNATEWAPIDKGVLRASGTTEEPVVAGTRITCRGGFNTSYAAAVHNNLEAHHPQGEAMYLAKTMREDRDVAMETIASEIRGGAGGGE